jgi:hypothetical protein
MKITESKLSFKYEQSKEQFVLQHRHYRDFGIVLFCIWAVYYSSKLFLMSYLWIQYDTNISFLTFVIPTVLFFGILFLCSCRVTWTLDANGLKQKIDTIFFSSVKSFPFHELLSIQYYIDNERYDLQSNPQVIVKTACGNIVILNSMLRKITIEECQWLAYSMQEVLLTLQAKQNGELLKEILSPSKTRWNIRCDDKYFEIICNGHWQVIPIIITTSLLFLTSFIYAIIMLTHCHILLDITPDVGWIWWQKTFFLIIIGLFCFPLLIIANFSLWYNAIRKIRWIFTDTQIIRRTSCLGLSSSQYITMTPPYYIMIRKGVPNIHFYHNLRFNFSPEGEEEIIITSKITKQKIILKKLTNIEANWLQEMVLQNCNRKGMTIQKMR